MAYICQCEACGYHHDHEVNRARQFANLEQNPPGTFRSKVGDQWGRSPPTTKPGGKKLVKTADIPRDESRRASRSDSLLSTYQRDFNRKVDPSDYPSGMLYYRMVYAPQFQLDPDLVRREWRMDVMSEDPPKEWIYPGTEIKKEEKPPYLDVTGKSKPGNPHYYSTAHDLGHYEGTSYNFSCHPDPYDVPHAIAVGEPMHPLTCGFLNNDVKHNHGLLMLRPNVHPNRSWAERLAEGRLKWSGYYPCLRPNKFFGQAYVGVSMTSEMTPDDGTKRTLLKYNLQPEYRYDPDRGDRGPKIVVAPQWPATPKR